MTQSQPLPVPDPSREQRGAGALEVEPAGVTAASATFSSLHRPRPDLPPLSGWRLALQRVATFVALFVGATASLATNLADPPEEESDAPTVACQTDEDCAQVEGLPYCVESFELCVQCRSDEHCGAQERCVEFACLAACDSSAQCEGELVCIEGLCRACSDDLDCGDPSMYCYTGPELAACRPLCTASEECSGPGYAANDVCRAGRCQSVQCGAPQDCLLDRELCNYETGLCESIVR